ncbi:MAG: GMC family oxidoreductase [Rhizobiaceae bacterium]
MRRSRNFAAFPNLEFDFVIVGAGSAGCALAARLAERTNAQVALLEAGPRDRNVWIHIPVGYYRSKLNRQINWDYKTEPERELNGRQITWPRAKVLGGCSAINGLLYIRGHPKDYDSWVEHGAAGWSWNDMLPIFRRMEDQERGADEFHGAGGPLGVVDLKPRHPLMDAYIKAAGEIGLNPNEDFNGPSQDGIGYFQLTERNGWRCSAATAYQIGSRHRKNLTVLTNSQVSQIMFEGRRAVGLKLLHDGSVITARREIILAAGVIGSPQLLELSGIGDPELLRAHDISVLHPNPNVGENLQDHLQVKLVFRASKPVTLNDVLNNPFKKIGIALEFALRRTGLMTIGPSQVCGFARILPGATRPDMQIHATAASSDDPVRGMDRFPGFTTSVSQMRPESRGSIHIQSGDPRRSPIIRANYLHAELDRKFFVRSVRYARQIARQSAIADFYDAELRPGNEVQNHDELLDFVRETATTNYHPVGTCRIGPDGNGVVDAKLRVYGTENLRVADASVMPVIVSGNTNAPTIAIGERLADIIAG